MAKEENKTLKLGAYICIVREGFAFFNKRSYEYGQRVVVDNEELLQKMISAGNRFVPEEEFVKEDGDIVRKVVSATRTNKTVEDVIRSSDAEKAKMKADYEAKIKELEAKLEASGKTSKKTTKKSDEKETDPEVVDGKKTEDK